MKTGTILLDHGSGGKLSHRLIADLVLGSYFFPGGEYWRSGRQRNRQRFGHVWRRTALFECRIDH